MFETAFKHLPKKKPKLPLVGAVVFNELKKIKTQIIGKPISCQCGAVLVNTAEVKQDSNLGLVFNCRFCGTLNIVDPNDLKQYPDHTITDIDFILDTPSTDSSTHISSNHISQNMVAIIDVSGSMSSGKLEAVKHSLIETIKDLTQNAPDTNFSLITFETHVYLHRVDGTSISMPTKIEHNAQRIRQWIIQQGNPFQPIRQHADQWIAMIQQLTPQDYTALGPALLGGVTQLRPLSQGRLILLTDGLANQGIGNLESVSTSGKSFYKQVAKEARDQSTIVEVVGVSNNDSSNLALQVLGQLAMETGGDIYYVSSHELQKAFAELRDIKYLGHDVSVTIKTPPQLKIASVTGGNVSVTSAEKIPIGAVQQDRELFVELQSTAETTDAPLPIQTQVRYRDPEGKTHLRVVTRDYDSAKSSKEYEESYDTKILTGQALQKAGEITYKQSMDDSSKYLKELQTNLEQASNSPHTKSSIKLIKKQLGEYQHIKEEQSKAPEKRSKGATLVGAAAPMNRDAEIAYSLKQMRTSTNKRFQAVEEEEEE